MTVLRTDTDQWPNSCVREFVLNILNFRKSQVRTMVRMHRDRGSLGVGVDSSTDLSPSVALELGDILHLAIESEHELLDLWESNRHLIGRNLYANLIDVFSVPKALRTITNTGFGPGGVDGTGKSNANSEVNRSEYMFVLEDDQRRKGGTPSMVEGINEFKRNWEAFTEGSLEGLGKEDWNNMVIAGGAVLACLLPVCSTVVPGSGSGEVGMDVETKLRKYYHNVAYRSSDIDIFLWGLSVDQAEHKMKRIYDIVKASIPHEVTCVRAKRAVSIHSQYPYRPIQIILRLYSSPAEILAGFDIDAACFAYDGNRVWGNPRSVVALMRQCNTIDLRRCSPAYEYRQAKYARRGFEVYVPSLKRENINPAIYDHTAGCKGLWRLLELERSLAKSRERQEARSQAQQHCSYGVLDGSRLNHTQKSSVPEYYAQRKSKSKMKLEVAADGEVQIQENNYDAKFFRIPYRPGWNATRVRKLVLSMDRGLNPPTNDVTLHRHLAFCGTMSEVLEDCCGRCPIPCNEEQREAQARDDRACIRGRINFFEEDFNKEYTGPKNWDEWAAGVYI